VYQKEDHHAEGVKDEPRKDEQKKPVRQEFKDPIKNSDQSHYKVIPGRIQDLTDKRPFMVDPGNIPVRYIRQKGKDQEGEQYREYPIPGGPQDEEQQNRGHGDSEQGDSVGRIDAVQFFFRFDHKKKLPTAEEVPYKDEVKHHLSPQKQAEEEGRKRIYQGKYKKNEEFPGAVETNGFPY
jgi:hypothetical protein